MSHLYAGTFVHTKIFGQLEFLQNAEIFVNAESGKIESIQNPADDSEIGRILAQNDAKVFILIFFKF